MNDQELEQLEEIRQEVLAQLKEKHGEDKVQQVDNLGEETTLRMMNGERIEGVEDWMYLIVEDFVSFLTKHHKLIFPKLN